jgi:hypothetical protein
MISAILRRAIERINKPAAPATDPEAGSAPEPVKKPAPKKPVKKSK